MSRNWNCHRLAQIYSQQCYFSSIAFNRNSTILPNGLCISMTSDYKPSVINQDSSYLQASFQRQGISETCSMDIFFSEFCQSHNSDQLHTCRLSCFELFSWRILCRTRRSTNHSDSPKPLKEIFKILQQTVFALISNCMLHEGFCKSTCKI